MTRVGHRAEPPRGWLAANRFLLLRRASQLGILGLFLLGPLAGVWLVTGNLSASLTLGVLPLTDPLLLLQSVLSGSWPVASGLIGAAIVLAFYALVGGRVFCSWVCPVNPITDLAGYLRRRLDTRPASRPSRTLRFWLLGLVVLLPLLTGVMAWEWINPVSLTHRGLIFGMGWAWSVLLAVFLYDLLIARNGWCGHLCPVGAFYALLGSRAQVRVAAAARERCDDCMDCFEVCPEPQVIKPALKGPGIGPLIADIQCTNCGRCIDVCSQEVFRFQLGRANPVGPTTRDAVARARA